MYQLDVCGSGSEIDHLRQQVQIHNLSKRVFVHGPCNRDSLLTFYGNCHIVVVPTTSSFAEGLNKVAVESVLAHRPVVTSRVSHALEIVCNAAYEVAPDDIQGYVDAIDRARTDLNEYQTKQSATEQIALQIYGSERTWNRVLERILVDFSVKA